MIRDRLLPRLRHVRATTTLIGSMTLLATAVLSAQTAAAPVATRTLPTLLYDHRGFLVTLATSIVYLVLLLVFRFYNITAPARELLLAQLDDIRTRLPIESDPGAAVATRALAGELASLRAHVQTPPTAGEFLFWSRGREIAAWTRLHEIERQLAAFVTPDSRVVERAQIAEARLRGLATPAAIALADRMHLTLAPASPPVDAAAAGVRSQQIKQQLAEALGMVYDDGDTKFASLMEWQNKAMWMVVSALLAILVLSLVFHHEKLFLLGAAGGLMSRMARSLFREDVPNDYGASWTTLFLSPLLGAIAAWFGIAIIELLVTLKVLGDTFKDIGWDADPKAITVALAFALGFSERMFTSLLSTLEGTIATPAKPAGQAAGSAPPVPPRTIAAGSAAPAPPSARRVTVRLAVLKAADLEPGSLALKVDEQPVSIAADGLVEVPLEVGRAHTIAVTARAAGRVVGGDLSITPTLDDEGKPLALTLAPRG